jgi:hypothetical protein
MTVGNGGAWLGPIGSPPKTQQHPPHARRVLHGLTKEKN